MKNAIVKLGFCILFFCTALSAYAANPVPTVTRVGSATQRSAAGQVSFTVTFDVDVTDFDDLPGDVALSGAGAAGATVTSITPVSAKVYTVLVSGLTISGTVKLSVPAGVTNSNDASSGEETITFDGNPAPVFSHPGQDDPTSGSRVIKYTVDFGETINGSTFTESDISFTGTDAAFGTLTVDAGSLTATTPDQIYTFTVTISGLPTINKHVIVSLPANKVKDTHGNDNNASTGDGDVTWSGTFPNLAKPTATFGLPPSNIDKINIQGNVIDAGGRTVTARGTVWSATSPVGPTDHDFQTGSGTGTFNQDRDNNIDAHMKVYYAIYAENGLGGRVLSEQNFIWTLDDEPTMNGDITNANSTSATNINLTFAARGTNADGLVILRKSGSSGYTASDLLQGKRPEDQPGYVDKITGAGTTGTTTYSDGTVSAGQTYTYVVVPYNVYLTQDSTTHYKQSFNSKTETTQSAVSRIVEKNAAAATLAYATKQGGTIAAASDGLVLADLALLDGNPPADDPDTKATELATLKIRIDNPANVNHVGLLVGSTVVAEGTLDGSGEITFTVPAGAILAADNDDAGKQFQIIANFKPTVTDGEQLKVTIVNATVTTTSSGLVNATAGSYSTPAGKNAIAVIATKFVISAITNPVNQGQPFGFTATLADNLDNIDTNIGGNVTLALNPADGTLTPASPSQAVSASGTVTFTNLVLSDAGDNHITLHATGSPGPSDQILLISVASLGVKVTPFSATVCVNTATANDATDPSSFTSVGPIVIEEQDKADFGVGTDQTFNLLLPTNFIFYVGSTPTITPTSVPAGAGDIKTSSPAPSATYLGNNILRVKYTVTAQAKKDVLTISNLMIKYIGTDTVKNQDIVRVGGTAVQKKNDDSDANSHGKLSASTKLGSPVSFKNTNGGSIKDNETRFPKASTTPIKLQGFIKAGPTNVTGVFSGDGIAQDTDGIYKFYPNSVSIGSHPITFTYTDPTTGCKTAATQVFEVFASSITGLNLQYCDNSPASTLTGQSAFPSSYTCPALTANAGLQQYTFEYYVYYDPSFGWRPLAGSTTTGNNIFDPGSPLYQSVYQSTANLYGFYGLFVGYQVYDKCYDSHFTWTYDIVRIERKPTASITTKFDYVCSNGAPIALKGNPNVTPGSAFDKFWISPVGNPGNGDTPTMTGVVGNSTIGYSFDPAQGMNGATGSRTMQLNYRYQASNGCSDQNSFTFTEFEKPSDVNLSDVKIDGVAVDVGNNFCETSKINPVNAKPAIGVLYNWYNAGGARILSESNDFDANRYLDVDADGRPDVGSLQFKITQTTNRQGKDFAGCESDPVNFTINIIQAPKVVLTSTPVKVCSGQDITLADLGGSIQVGSGQPTLGGTWSSPTAVSGSFVNTGGNPETSLQFARTYHPTQADKDARGVVITLTSASPTGVNAVCAAASGSIVVAVNSNLTVNAPPDITYCASTQSFDIKSEVINNGVPDLNANVTWSILSGGTDTSMSGINSQTVHYTPTDGERAGAAITFKVETDDPDGSGPGGGPCTADSDQIIVTINKRALVTAGTDFSICADASIRLNGTLPPGTAATSFAWSGGAGSFDDPTKGNAKYTPDASESTLITPITFTLTSNDPDGAGPCGQETSTVTVTLFPKPSVPTIAGYADTDVPDYKYCVNDVFQDLSASGVDITWYSDSGLNNSRGTGLTFPPAAGGASTSAANNYSFWVTQTTNKSSSLVNGCRSDGREIKVTVNPLPVPSFTASNFCLTDQTEFIDTSTVPGSRSIVSWSWDFADGLTPLDFGGEDVPVPAGTHAGKTTGTYNDPIHEFASIGVYDVKLTVRSSDGCVQTANAKSLAFFGNKEIRIGAKPKADFSFAKVCDGDETKFNYTGTIPAEISTWDWDFDDGSSNGTGISPLHEFPGVGEYNVTLTATTDLGCIDVITKRTNIVPYVTTFPYIETFDSSNHGWFADGLVFDGSSSTAQNSWNLTTSAGSITSDPFVGAGPKFWATNTNTGSPDKAYFDNERSVLYGPCVNMTTLLRPVIALDYFNDMESRGDGAYVEFKLEDAATGAGTWERLGDDVQGLDWYNGASIGGLSSLGGIGQAVSQFGWTGSSTEWKTGRYNLDDKASATRIRFRIVFGSNSSLVNTDTYDGFAIDNFKLESRNRLVLVENFTNSNAVGAAANNAAFRTFPSVASSSEVVKIEYHTSVAGQGSQDPIYKQNPMDPNARASFYGINSVPRAYIDGYSDGNNGGIFSTGAGSWTSTYYNKESLKTAPIDIIIDTPTILAGEGVLTVSGSIKARDIEIPGNRYTLYIAVVEEEVGDDKFILRKMLPSASGTKVSGTPQGSSFNFSESWSIDESYFGSDNPKLIAIAFVQADIPNKDGERVVLQAAFNDNTPTLSYTTGVEMPFLEQTAIYPNPADGIVNIELPQATQTGVQVSILDQLGREVTKSSIGTGQKSASINTGDLSGAVYIVQLKENGVITTRRLVVTHNHR